MRTPPIFFALLLVGCVGGAAEKPFDQMSAVEHQQAADREDRLADEDFAKIHENDVTPPETDVNAYYWAYERGPMPYTYAPTDPWATTAWPRVSDPNEKYEDAATRHRENAERHRAAADQLALQSPARGRRNLVR